MYTMGLHGYHIKLFTEQFQCKHKYFSIFERRGKKQRLFLNWDQFVLLTYGATFKKFILILLILKFLLSSVEVIKF